MTTASCTARVKPLLVSAKQAEFRRSKEFIRGFVGGRGSGKTRIGAQSVLLTATDGEPWMSVSPSFPIIHETTLPTFIEVAQDVRAYIRHVSNPLPRVTFRTQDHGVADIVFRSGEDPEKLRGPSKAGLWIDEASITHAKVFEIGIAVLRWREKMGPVFLTFTPKGKRHWTFEVFYEPIDPLKGAIVPAKGSDGAMLYVRTCQQTGQTQRLPIESFGGIHYVRKPNAALIRAHTLDNPFLPAEFFDNIRLRYSSTLAAQELAGEFVELEGLMFQRAWFEVVSEVPRDASRVRYWDRAATEGGGSYSAGVLMARDRLGIFYVEDVVRGQWSPHARDAVILETARRDAAKYGNTVLIYLEQEGGSGGKEVAQQALVKLAGYPVYLDVVSGKRLRKQDNLVLPGQAKMVRAMPMAAQAEAGNVRVLNASWTPDYLDEMAAFPEYAFADQVDASSGAFNKLASQAFVGAAPMRVESPGIAERAERFGVHLTESRERRARFGGNGGHRGGSGNGE